MEVDEAVITTAELSQRLAPEDDSMETDGSKPHFPALTAEQVEVSSSHTASSWALIVGRAARSFARSQCHHTGLHHSKRNGLRYLHLLLST